MLPSVVILALGLGGQAGLDEVLPPGTPLSFKAHAMAGGGVGSDSLRGSPSLVVLWGTWSPAAARSLEIAQAMHEKYSGRGLRVVSLASWDTREDVAAFQNANPNLKFAFWWDPAGKETGSSIAVNVFRTRKFPTFYVLDSQVRVVQGFVAFKAGDKAALESAIERAR